MTATVLSKEIATTSTFNHPLASLADFSVPSMATEARLEEAEIFHLQCQFLASALGRVPEKSCFFMMAFPSPDAPMTILVSESAGQLAASDGYMNSLMNLLFNGLVAVALQKAPPAVQSTPHSAEASFV